MNQRKSIFIDDDEDPSQLGSSTDGWFQGAIGPNSFISNAATSYMFNQGVNNLYGAVNQNINKYSSYYGYMKHYFQVDNSYVLRKILLLFFPFSNKNWNRAYEEEEQAGVANDIHINVMMKEKTSDSRDINEPELYIPTMSFITYILIVAGLYGLMDQFSPDLLGKNLISGVSISILEVILVRLGTYLFNVDCSILDIGSYCGYKYISVILTMIVGMCFGSYAYYGSLLLFSLFMCYFIIMSLRGNRIVKSSNNQQGQQQQQQQQHGMASPHNLAFDHNPFNDDNDENNKSRLYFFLIVGFLQVPLIWYLSHKYSIIESTIEPVVKGTM